jgi:hypothetical protein
MITFKIVVFLDNCHEKNVPFKMFVDGNDSGYDLEKCMQLGGNHQIAWIMFDHVKHVVSWTTLAYHVYDPIHCK